MFQKISTSLVVAILGLVSLLSAASAALAQGDLGFPPSVSVSELASGDVPDSLSAPGTITLDRVTLPVKAGLPVRQIPAIEILYVEKGTLTVADGLGLSSALPAEKSVHLRAGSSYTAINDGDSEVSYLRLSVVVSSPAATPVMAAATEASASAVVTSLATFDLSTLPASPTTLFLDRATWKAGADTGAYTQNGPIGMYTESGTLTITSPSGIDGELGKGKAVLLPAEQELRTRNDGQDDAVALMFGVVPANGPAVTTSAEVVGPAVGSPGTPGTSADVASTAAGTVLYQADSSGGFEKWPKGSGWTAVGGMLAGDGSVDSRKPIVSAAPFVSPVSDYAVEVELQWVRDGSSYGVIVRGGDDGGYWVGGAKLCPSSNTEWVPVVWAGFPQTNRCSKIYDRNAIAVNYDVALNADWHTYRIEVQGNAIRVFLDGTKVIETSDNRFLTSGQIGVFSTGAQVSVRRFTVYAL